MKLQLTLSQAIEGFLLEKEAQRLSPHTIADYRNAFRKLQSFLGDDPLIDDITAGQIRQFLADLGARPQPMGGAAPRSPKPLSKKTVYNIHTEGPSDGGAAWGIYAKAWQSGGGGSATVIAKNNYVGDVTAPYDSVHDCYDAKDGGVLTQSYNVSSDSTAVGDGCLTLKTDYATYFASITDGSENLHLTNTSANLWGGSAEDLSGEFTTDVDGGTRSAPWDMGADEYGAPPNSAPSAPNTPYSNNTTAQSGATNPTGITDPTPAFSAIYNDFDSGDIANKYQVEVNTASDFDGTVMWDSGASGTSMADTTEGSRCPDIIYAGLALVSDTTYYWRVKFFDDDGA
ncbi:MAG: hypothetical protein ACK2UA_07210, partial [Anaerolineae bacterium]